MTAFSATSVTKNTARWVDCRHYWPIICPL